MDREAIIRLTVKTTQDLANALDLFTGDQFNLATSADSWTAGQVADHIHLSSSGIAQVLKGPSVLTFREPDEKVRKLKDIFLDFSTKMQSPDFIQPSKGPHSKEQLGNTLANEFATLLKAAETLALSETCLGFQLPQMGSFTRIEWIAFVNYHTQRHIQQLKNIAAQIQNTAAATSTVN
jgi:hypothetical protein